MKKSKIVLCCMIWLLFFCFICFSSLSHAAKIKHDTWSFNFKNCSVSDALILITETTGIDVFTDKPINKKLYKFYDASTIDQILRDIFRQENYAMVWYYSENGLDSVGIWVFESSGSNNNNFHQTKSFRKTRANDSGTRKKVDYKSVSAKGRSNNDNLICLKDKSKNHAKASKSGDFRSEKLSTGGGQPVSNDLSQGLQKYRVNKKSTGTSAMLNDNSETGVHDSNVETTDKYTLSPPPVPDKWHGLEPPPMPPGFSGKN